MADLKFAIEKIDEVKFSEILINEIYDQDEVLMLLFTALVCFNSEKGFDILLKRSNYFKIRPEWH